MAHRYEELVIVGAGPAGLAAANAAASAEPLVIDAGSRQDQRRHAEPTAVVQGVGGAGLFSDGKLSFFPSATSVWGLESILLRRAYAWLRHQTAKSRIVVPPLTQEDIDARSRRPASHEKRYPSVYMPFEDRFELISSLASKVRRLALNSRVVSLRRAGRVWELTTAGRTALYTRKVVLATGRYGPLLMTKVLPEHVLRFQRLEVGVRIEQKADQFFLQDHPGLDPKYVWIDESGTVEWRTFCCCREGKVVLTEFQGIRTVSGRADCDPTGRSNIGFNVRFNDPDKVGDLLPNLLASSRSIAEPATERLETFLKSDEESKARSISSVLGPVASRHLSKGLHRLIREFPARSLSGATLVGPTLEGVGRYPVHDSSLGTPLPGLWVAGDACGSFRGLTAAMVSGYIAGTASVQRR